MIETSSSAADQIVDVAVTYAFAIDDRDWEALRSYFAHDVAWEYNDLEPQSATPSLR
nr:nuclear transport factor 2 family protein [Georgenia ruanii]